MTTARYDFLHERISALILASGRLIEDIDVEDAVREHADLPSDQVGTLLAFDQDSVTAAADLIAGSILVTSARAVEREESALSSLQRHADCEGVIENLLIERDSLIAAVEAAQKFCCNDVWNTGYGGLYVNVDGLLNALRPRIAQHHRRSLDQIHGRCDECSETWIHTDYCALPAEAEDSAARAAHEVQSHRHCAEVAREVLEQIRRQYEHIERVAGQIRRHARDELGSGHVVSPHRVLEVLGLEQPCEAVKITSITARISPPLADLEICDEQGVAHSEPHRACPWPVS